MMKLDDLAGMHVLVVGASSGMGEAVARQAFAAGARLTLMGRDRARLEGLAQQLPGAAFRVIDLKDNRTVAEAVEGLEGVAHLVVTAGTFTSATLAQSQPDEWRDLLEERLIGPLLLIKALGSRLTGSITLFTGSTVRRPKSGSVLATAALGGVEAMVRALAIELAPVRANAVSPGMIATPLLDRLLGDRRDAAVAATAQRLPVGRIGTPDDAASAALFLMTNPFVTGVTIELDGGAPLV